ncbi:MAG: zeta toxin family protein [Bdellovibrionales bacterium]|nr:zeta toxin family protein [Bdellovibrionales bacterium]
MSQASQILASLSRINLDSLDLPPLEEYFDRGEADSILANLLFHDSVLDPTQAMFFTHKVEHPRILVIGGGVGSGKDFLYHSFLRSRRIPLGAILHDPDTVMSMLSGFQRDAAKNPASAFHRWESTALRIALELLPIVLAYKRNLVYMRTLSSEFCLSFLRESKERFGYQIETHLLTCDIERALSRAHKRAEKDRRKVPDEEIVIRRKRVKQHFSRLREISDSLVLWENNSEEDHPEMIAQFTPVSESITNAQRYDVFLASEPP